MDTNTTLKKLTAQELWKNYNITTRPPKTSPLGRIRPQQQYRFTKRQNHRRCFEYYNLYLKTAKQKIDIDQHYDLLALEKKPSVYFVIYSQRMKIR